MKNKMRKFLMISAAISVVVANSLCCFASMREVIYIYANKAWDEADYHLTTRTMKYSDVYARNHAVYPTTGGFDTFSSIWVRVEDGYGMVISNETQLLESATADTSIPINEGYLDKSMIGFAFRGNSNNEAYADVSYDGR